jgi:hypothetical protein
VHTVVVGIAFVRKAVMGRGSSNWVGYAGRASLPSESGRWGMATGNLAQADENVDLNQVSSRETGERGAHGQVGACNVPPRDSTHDTDLQIGQEC